MIREAVDAFYPGLLDTLHGHSVLSGRRYYACLLARTAEVYVNKLQSQDPEAVMSTIVDAVQYYREKK